MRTIFLAVSLMVCTSSFTQNGMQDYIPVSTKQTGNVKIFVEPFRTYIYNVDFIEDAVIYDTEIDNVLSEFQRILIENNVCFKSFDMDEMFETINREGYIQLSYKKRGIEYIATIQDEYGQIIVINEQ